ncbi:MAG: helix-turn-helix domain-containing protein [Bacteroidota bacterium]
MDTLSLFHLLLLVGAVQGIVMGGSLWLYKGEKQKANRLLALMLWFLAYRLVVLVLWDLNIATQQSIWYHVFLEYNWVFGPLLFFYVKAYLWPDFRINRKDWPHFIPVILEFCFSNFIKTQNFFWDGTRESLSWAGYYGYYLWMHTPFQLMVASGLVWWYVMKSRKLINTYTASETQLVEIDQVKWLKKILFGYQMFVGLMVPIGLADYFFFDYAFNPWYIFPLYGGLAIITYSLGMQGFARRNEVYLKAPAGPATTQLPPTKLPPQEQEQIDRLLRSMSEEKLFTNSQLSLADLAEANHLKPYQLTQILNRHLEKNFSDFVNAYRVEEATRLMKDKTGPPKTLLAIAFEAGFNSKASFNRIFKKITGLSPREMREQAYQNGSIS